MEGMRPQGNLSIAGQRPVVTTSLAGHDRTFKLFVGKQVEQPSHMLLFAPTPSAPPVNMIQPAFEV